MHKAGFVNIIGKPNVGKSSLMNALIGHKLAAVTHKAQTTRHRIFGILNSDTCQIVFSDTPGLIKPAYLMQERMMAFVDESLEDADVFLVMTDVSDNFDMEEVLKKIEKSGKPIVVAINKCDLSTQEDVKKLIAERQKRLPQANIIPISALQRFNLDLLVDTLTNYLPAHEAFFPKDDLSSHPLRFFVSEIIREKIFLLYEKEIPYAVEVAIEEYKDLPHLARIRAVIFVERLSQKGIIIGKEGKALKEVGVKARKDIESLVEKKVFLELHVKVLKNWKSEKKYLKKFGFNSGQ